MIVRIKNAMIVMITNAMIVMKTNAMIVRIANAMIVRIANVMIDNNYIVVIMHTREQRSLRIITSILLWRDWREN